MAIRQDSGSRVELAVVKGGAITTVAAEKTTAGDGAAMAEPMVHSATVTTNKGAELQWPTCDRRR